MPIEALLFALVLNNLVLAKTIRYYAMRYYRGVTLADLRDASLITAAVALVLLLPGAWAPALALALLAAFSVVLLGDAVLFNRYSFTINPGSVRIFLRNSGAFLDERGRFVRYVRRRRFWLYPLAVTLVSAALLDLVGPAPLRDAIVCAYLVYSALLYTKSRFSLAAVAGGAAVGVGLWLTRGWWPAAGGGEALLLAPAWTIALALGFAALVTLALPWLRRWSQTPPVQLGSTLLPMFGHQPVRVKPDAPPHPLHQRILRRPGAPAPSSLHGRLAGANVIVLTVESFSRYQTRALSGTGASLPFFESWLDGSSQGRRHFAISPNTYQTLFTLYKGHYPTDDRMPPVGVLNDAGYRSVFLTPHRLALFDTDRLIGACNFDEVYSAESFADELRAGSVQAWGASDRAVYERALADFDAHRDQRPLFLGIINSQTHLPYHVYDQARFNRHRDGGILARYLNALEEADDCLGYLFEELRARGVLDNALVILTGDHGESFGESNYKGHSNAITREQLEVPFLLNHPSLTPTHFDFSTHFDVFPTIFDLLGLQTDIPLAGSSLYAEQRDPAFVAYSRTYQGELPTCFGYVHEEGKLFVDLVYNRYWQTDLDDNLVAVCAGRERDALLRTLHQALRERKLLGEPKIGRPG